MIDAPAETPARANGGAALFAAQCAAVLAVTVGTAMGNAPYAPSPWFWAYAAQYFLGAALCLRAARAEQPGPSRHVWRLLAVASASTGVIVLLNGLLRPTEPAARIAMDLGAIAFYPLVVAAMFFLGPRPAGDRTRERLDLAVVGVATITLGAFLWMSASESTYQLSLTSVVYGIALPIGALLVLFATLAVALRYGSRRPRRSDIFVMSGVMLCTLTDVGSAFNLHVAATDRLGWALGILLVGIAAWIREGDIVRYRALAASGERPVARAAAVDTDRPPALAYAAIGAVALTLLVEVVPGLSIAARVLLVGGLLLGAVLVAREIIASRANRALERAREEQAAQFRAVVERSSDALLIVGPGGEIRYHTPSLAEMTGVPAPAGTLHDLVLQSDRAAVTGLLAELAEAPGRTGAVTLRRLRGDRTLEVTGINRLDEPAIGGLVLGIRDTTDRRRLELQLQQAQKMDGLGRLAGGIAHDFNNLLTAIIGYAELAQRQARQTGADDLALREIMRAGRQATELTGQLLAFSRRQPLAPRIVSLPDTVREMERMIGRLLREDIEVHVSEGDDVPLVLADPTQLQQVVLNLAVNARDAMPHGGVLVLSTRRLEADEAYRRAHPRSAAGLHAVLEVSDTGIGMTPDVLAQAFEPFFTTKPEGAGTGLGLATVYGIVTQAGGHVTVDSTPGRGTTFRIAIPAVADEALARRPARVSGQVDAIARATETAVPVHGTVMLVEDNDAVRELATGALRDHGFEVIVASGGAQALVSIALRRQRVDLLVTDVLMPGIGGIELARAMRDRLPDLPILFATAYSERDPIRALGGDAPSAVLAKPFTAEQLATAARRLVHESREYLASTRAG